MKRGKYKITPASLLIVGDSVVSRKRVSSVDSLNNIEIVSMLIGGKNAYEQARVLLEKNNDSLSNLSKLTAQDMMGLVNITPLAAERIECAFNLSTRVHIENAPTHMISGRAVADFMAPKLKLLPHEEFWVIMLNRQCNLIGAEKVSQGGMASTVVDPKIIFGKALAIKATNIVVCHNHPSGATKPSTEDINLTHRLVECGKLMALEVIDHIIVAGDNYFSFVENGMLK